MPRRLFANFSREVILLRSDDSGILRDIDLLEWIAGRTLEEQGGRALRLPSMMRDRNGSHPPVA